MPADQKHYKRLASTLNGYKAIGIDNVWLPPACKAADLKGNGYDIYDLYDLGEFHQREGVATKWGTKDELKQLSTQARELGIGMIFDAVLNHRSGADYMEKCMAIEVDDKDRTKEVGKPIEIDAWVGFDFPGRGNKYSSQKYHSKHFSGTDTANGKKTAIYKFLGQNKNWAQDVDHEKGNFDYLMFADVDYSQKEVREDVKNWGEWVTNELSLSGFRIDAVKHISRGFLNEWFGHMNAKFGADRFFFLCEHWTQSVPRLLEFLDQIKHRISLYDASLLHNFSEMSSDEKLDLRAIFNNTLVSVRPHNAVTLVMNHDTQAGQTEHKPVADWFKPLAYALILLRQDGYPCVFYGDLHGIEGPWPQGPSCKGKLADLIAARTLYAYGSQKDYFDTADCIGWTRDGTWDRPDGVAVIMSKSKPSRKQMSVGALHAGEIWTDVLNNSQEEVKIDRNGFGVFSCPGQAVSVFVKKNAAGRDGTGKISLRSALCHPQTF